MMASPWLATTAQRLQWKETRAGIPAILLVVVLECFATRWLLLPLPLPAGLGTSRSPQWAAVLVVAAGLGVGIMGWSMASRRDVGLLFLWAMAMAGTVTVAGALALAGFGVDRLGYAALALLAAITIHFHAIFPRLMRPGWRKLALAGAYGIAGLLALVWLLYPHPYTHNLRLLSRAFFGVSAALAWARMYYVGKHGANLEEKWVGRWLSMVLFVGGLIPAWGFLVSGVLLGRPLMPLWVAYLLELAVPAGYFVMVRRYAPWCEGEPASRIVSAAVVVVIVITTLGWGWTALAMVYPDKGIRIGSAAALAALFYPLYRLGRQLLENDLYGGWYERDRFLNGFAVALAEEEDEESIWRRAVRLLAEGMKIKQVCGRSVAGACFCWRIKSGESGEGCLGDPELSLPVEVEGEKFGTLLLSLHIERSGLGRKDWKALVAAGRMMGVQLASVRLRTEVARLQAELDAYHAAGVANSQRLLNPLTDREKAVLELAAQGLRNKQIAKILKVSRRTVEAHLWNVQQKLGTSSKVESVAKALKRGWIE